MKYALKYKLNLLTTKKNNTSNFYICLSGGINSLTLVKMISDTILGTSSKYYFKN